MTGPGRRVAGAVVAVAGLAGILTGAAVADHISDVPSSNVFHEDITALLDAGCALGFNDGTYRPRDPVNRQQTARIVRACGGRIGIQAGSATLTTTNQTLGHVDLTAGALEGGGGGGFALLALSAQASSTSTTGYPCEAEFTVDGFSGEETWVDLRTNTADATEHGTGVGMATRNLEGGEHIVLPVRARLTDPTCTASVTGSFRATVQYYPFDGEGNGGG